MEADDSQIERPEKQPSRTAWFSRRKRIVAREVHKEHSEEIEKEMVRASRSLMPADVIDAPPPIAPQQVEPLVDLNVFTERHRKRRANFIYRLTQVAITIGTLAATVGIFCALQEDPISARVLSGAACGLGLVAVLCVRKSALAHRLRGYAAAMCVLAMISLCTSWIPISLHSDSIRPASGAHAQTPPAQ